MMKKDLKRAMFANPVNLCHSTAYLKMVTVVFVFSITIKNVFYDVMAFYQSCYSFGLIGGREVATAISNLASSIPVIYLLKIYLYLLERQNYRKKRQRETSSIL